METIPEVSTSNSATSGLTTPLSDVTVVTDATTSSNHHREDQNEAEPPRTEQRLYVINRAGTGEASYLLLAGDHSAIASYRVHTETWRHTYDVTDFGVVALGKSLYVIGGFHKGKKTCLNRVLR